MYTPNYIVLRMMTDIIITKDYCYISTCVYIYIYARPSLWRNGQKEGGAARSAVLCSNLCTVTVIKQQRTVKLCFCFKLIQE